MSNLFAAAVVAMFVVVLLGYFLGLPQRLGA